MSNEAFSLGSASPKRVLRPNDPNELAALLAQCNREQCAVVAWGGGTLQHLGNPPAHYDAVLQTTNLNQVVEYAYDDLTVTVQAGMTLAHIERTLAEHGQFLPIDVPHPEQATIGGVLATGSNGPLRLRYGPARDFMIGNRFATVDGHIIKAGSKVVKNVAGYELHKVQVGAFGTLGVLTEATFKVFPKPTAEISLWASFDQLSAACAAVPKLWNMPTPPLAIELFNLETLRALESPATGAWHIAAHFGGLEPSMKAARDMSVQIAQANGASAAAALDDAVTFWRTIADLPATLRESSPNALLLRVSVPPKELLPILQNLFALADTQKLAPPRILAHAAIATIYCSLEGEPNALRALVSQLRAQLHDRHAHLFIESAPASLKNLDVWDEVGATFRLMQSLKHKFDPNNILNPGRFVGGL